MAAVTFSINAIDKTRAAFAQVDRGLKNLINGGDATQKKLLSMGLQAAGLGSALTVLGMQIRKVATETENVPGIDDATIDSWNRLKSVASTTGGVLQNMTAAAGRGVSDLIGLIRFGWIAAIDGLDEAQRDLLQTDALAAAARRDASGQIKKEIDSMRKLGEARKQLRLIRIRESTGDSIVRRREEADMLERQASGVADLARKNELLTQAVKLRTDAEKDLISLQDKANDAQAKRIAGEEDVARVWQFETKSLRELNREREKTERLLGRANYAWLGGDLNAMEDAIRLNNKLSEIDKDRLQIMGQQKALAQQVGATMASAFEDAVLSGNKLSDVLRGLGQDLLRMMLRQTVTAPLAGFLSGALGGLFGGGKAIGGPVSAGTSYLVGEKGPELFTPSQAGRIVPNHEMTGSGGGGGGPSFVFNYNLAAGISRAELMPALEATRRATIADIMNMRVRGGSRAALA